LEPPGAMTTAEPLRFSFGGRNAVRKGTSRGPVPTASGTFPAGHSGMLTCGSSADRVVANRAAKRNSFTIA